MTKLNNLLKKNLKTYINLTVKILTIKFLVRKSKNQRDYFL